MTLRTLALLTLLLLPAALVRAEEEAAKSAETAAIAEITLEIADAEDPPSDFPFGPKSRNLRELLATVRRAAADPKVDAVLFRPKSYGVGWARLLEVRDGLKALRASGKKVFVYQESMSAPDLALLSLADRISMPESGSVMLPGLAVESLYMKRLLDKLRIRFDVIHIGEYKSAGESFVRETMSDELKQSLDPILDEMFESMVQAIAEGRRIPADAVKAAIDKGILSAREAQAAGLIDRVEYADQFRAGMEAFFPGKKVTVAAYERKQGPKIDANNPMAALMQVMNLLSGAGREKPPAGPKIAVIYCTGTIVSGTSQYGWTGEVAAMGSETIVAAIDEAARNDEVKAIVLRINSPGGSGLASDIIWRASARAKERKPVLSSMGDVAASGGYYIAANSTLIVAEPQTITGSIGVVGMIPNLEGFLQWVGMDPQRLTRGKRAAALLTTQGFGDEDREIFRAYMKAFYDDFVAKVAAGRGRTPAEIEPLARGRIWSGRKARELGLVDELGGLERAIALAREKGGIPADAAFHILESPQRAGPFEMLDQLFSSQASAEFAALAALPGMRTLLDRIAVARLAAVDRICCIAPELEAFASPLRARVR